MKTKLNTTAFLKQLSVLIFIMIIACAPAIAYENNGDKKKENKELSAEDSVMIEELVIELDFLDDVKEVSQESTFQVFDANDQLIFSGNKKQWNNKKDMKLIMIKRKAEYLFESDGTQVFKIF